MASGTVTDLPDNATILATMIPAVGPPVTVQAQVTKGQVTSWAVTFPNLIATQAGAGTYTLEITTCPPGQRAMDRNLVVASPAPSPAPPPREADMIALMWVLDKFAEGHSLSGCTGVFVDQAGQHVVQFAGMRALTVS
jgi:hypothetical protein